MKRLIAWVVLALCFWGVAQAVKAWTSPWAIPSGLPSSPVLSHLPPSHTGCGEKCRYD